MTVNYIIDIETFFIFRFLVFQMYKKTNKMKKISIQKKVNEIVEMLKNQTVEDIIEILGQIESKLGINCHSDDEFKKVFTTTRESNGKYYSGQIIANTWDDAEQLAAKNEIVVGILG